MEQKKEAKKIKVRDLKPKKDAKGGTTRMQGVHQNQGHQNQSRPVPFGPHSNT
jgi:hypothetical protein